MSGQLSMFDLTTCGPIVSATSSEELEAGQQPSVSPDGATTDLFGAAVAPVKTSAPPAKEQVARTSGTYGRIGSVSSASADLQSFLARMLRRRLDGAGSMLFSATWRRKVTPRGRQYWEHTASARRTSGSGFGSWQTPTAMTQKGGEPSATEGMARRALRRGAGNLLEQVALASWPTPTRDEAGGTAEQFLERKRKLNGACGVSLTALNLTAQLASWPTPTMQDQASSGAAGYGTESGRHSGTTLTDAARFAAWATPTSRDHKDGAAEGTVPINGLLGRQVWAAHGTTSSGSLAATEKRGQLNPAFSRWLMGYPSSWDQVAPSKVSRGSAC